VLTPSRREEFESVHLAVRAWASGDDDVVAVALVGSWARDEARMDSDIDVVVISRTERFVEDGDWVEHAAGPGAMLVGTADWGALIERRVRLPSGLEVEFGFVRPSWAAIDPIDPGTRRVVTEDCVPWYDPSGVLALLREAAVRQG
jgi:predicted nucleotidyltransferase